MQLLFYDRVICLADDLAVVPMLADMVGIEYLVELLRRRELRLLRSRLVPGLRDGWFVWIALRAKGVAEFGRHDWPKAVFASELPEAAAWVARRGLKHLDEPQIKDLKEAIIAGTTEVPRDPIGVKVFAGLADEVSRLNELVVNAGHHLHDVIRLEAQGDGRRVAILSEAVDRDRLERAVLNLVGLRHDAVLPSLCGLDGPGCVPRLHRSIPCGWEQVWESHNRGDRNRVFGLEEGDMRVLQGVRRSLDMPNAGELLRTGKITPDLLVELRESEAGRNLRRWYADNVADDPRGAAGEVMELIASRTKGSAGLRVVNFLFGRLLSRFVSIGAAAAGAPPGLVLMANDIVSAVHTWVGMAFARMVCDHDHPLTIVEHLRQRQKLDNIGRDG
jgi:hypothetical protein